MSVFAEDFAGIGVPAQFENQGQTVQYVDATADDLTLTAVVGNIRSEQAERSGDTILERTRDVSVGTDPTSVFGGVASPRAEVNGIPIYFVISGELWDAIAVTITESIARFTCVQRPIVEAGREGLRRVT